MGTKFAPAYVTLSIGYLEVKLYVKVTEVFGENLENVLLLTVKNSSMIDSSRR